MYYLYEWLVVVSPPGSQNYKDAKRYVDGYNAGIVPSC